MNKFDNKRQQTLTEKVCKDVGAEKDKDFTDRTTFNFLFFDNSGKYGERFNEWDHNELVTLLEELKRYSEKSLTVWQSTNRGGGVYFANYPDFPNGSTFKLPQTIPAGAKWGSLRISTKMRVIGFRMTGKFQESFNLRKLNCFDDNIFYVVWLDKNHKAFPRQDAGKIRR